MSEVPESTILLEATRNTASLQAGLAGVIAKLDALREMFVDHKTNTGAQLIRIDRQMNTLTQDQRSVDLKVDKQWTEVISQKTEILRQLEETKKAVQALDIPVSRWRELESRLRGIKILFALLGGGIFGIISHFWPIVSMLLSDHTR